MERELTIYEWPLYLKAFLNLNSLTEGSVEDYEEFISKYEDKELHSNHYHLATAKHSLMQMLGRNEGYLIQDMPMNLVII